MLCMQGLNGGILLQQALGSRTGKEEPPLTVGHIMTRLANQILIKYRTVMHILK